MSNNIKDSLVKDPNGTSVQIGSSFGTIGSPVSLTAGVNALDIPDGAVEVILYPITGNLRVSEDSTMTTYDQVAKDAKESFPCARMTQIYLEGAMSDVVFVRFTIV